MQTVNNFIMKNLIYCEDTDSLVHRMWDEWGKDFPKTHSEAQNSAWKIVGEMNEEEKRNNHEDRKAIIRNETATEFTTKKDWDAFLKEQEEEK